MSRLICLLFVAAVSFKISKAEDCLTHQVAHDITSLIQTEVRPVRLAHDASAGISNSLGAASQKKSLPYTFPKMCKPGSEVMKLSARSTAQEEADSTRLVTLADYPSSGSTWLRIMLSAVAVAHNISNPTCAIYGDDTCCNPTLAKDIFCDCEGFDEHPEALLVKSHFPAQELWHGTTLKSDQYPRTMRYSKLLQLVRHPAALAMSNVKRWGGYFDRQLENMYCWGTWWERAKQTAGNASFMSLRYEDLCLNTAERLHDVFQFLGGRFATIKLERIQEILNDRSDLACRYGADELISQMKQGPEGTQELVGELFAKAWGYEVPDEVSLILPEGRATQASLIQHVQKSASGATRGKRWLSERNPWAEAW